MTLTMLNLTTDPFEEILKKNCPQLEFETGKLERWPSR